MAASRCHEGPYSLVAHARKLNRSEQAISAYLQCKTLKGPSCALSVYAESSTPLFERRFEAQSTDTVYVYAYVYVTKA